MWCQRRMRTCSLRAQVIRSRYRLRTVVEYGVQAAFQKGSAGTTLPPSHRALDKAAAVQASHSRWFSRSKPAREACRESAEVRATSPLIRASVLRIGALFFGSLSGAHKLHADGPSTVSARDGAVACLRLMEGNAWSAISNASFAVRRLLCSQAPQSKGSNEDWKDGLKF